MADHYCAHFVRDVPRVYLCVLQTKNKEGAIRGDGESGLAGGESIFLDVELVVDRIRGRYDGVIKGEIM